MHADPLRRLVQPTAIVWGEHARLVPLEGARAFRAARPDVDLTVLDHAGDFPHVERAAEVAEGILAFLKRAGHWREKAASGEAGRAA